MLPRLHWHAHCSIFPYSALMENAMLNSPDSMRPVVVRQGNRIFIDVDADDADELQFHLQSHNIRTAIERLRPGVTSLEVFDLNADDVEAVLGEWEVPTA